MYKILGRHYFLITCFLSCLSVSLAYANSAGTVTSIKSMHSHQSDEWLSDNDWVNIQQQISSNRYRAYANKDSGYSASNPALGWDIDYAENGATTLTSLNQVATAQYHLGIKLEAVGYQNLQVLNKPISISNQNEILSYQWNNNVREWWINSDSKLEQWFSLSHKPDGASNGKPLILQLSLNTTLKYTQNGNSIHFKTTTGNSITYDTLKVWDAMSRELPAHMQLSGNTLNLIVDDSTAQYPITIDPSFQQQAYLKASYPDINDWFGFSVAIDGNTAVIGAQREDSNNQGVNGNQHNELMPDSGAAYVFIRDEDGWHQQAYLKASDPEENDLFGSSVAISGNTIIIGAPGKGNRQGASYIFTRTGNNWSQQASLQYPQFDTACNSFELCNIRFANSVAIENDTVVIGAPGENSGAIGVNGDQLNLDKIGSGAAYIYTRSGNTWTQQAYLKASNTGGKMDNGLFGDNFGRSVAISGNSVVIGAALESSDANGVNADQNNDFAISTGAAYVFVRHGSRWSQQAYLKASNPDRNDYFGNDVDIFGDTLVVGAPGEDSNAKGINGNQGNNLAANSGAVYLFTRHNNLWIQQAYLKAHNADKSHDFGISTAISENNLVVGAMTEDSDAVGVNGSQSETGLRSSGAAYVFTRDHNGWHQQDHLKAPNPDIGDWFGISVSIDDEIVVIGARNEDSNASGVNGNLDDNSIFEAGAAYIYHVTDDIPVINNEVSGFVWLDNNGDGLQTPGEPGFMQAVPDIGVVSVGLYPRGSDEPIAVSLLDESSAGFYRFNDITPGVYYVCISKLYSLLGLSVTIQDAGDNSIDNDFNSESCLYNIVVTNTQGAVLDMGLVGDPLTPVPSNNDDFNDIIVNTHSLLINHQWRPANQANSTSDSVHFFTAPSNNGAQRGVTRMRRSNNSAEFRFQEWSNLDGYHTNETINIASFPRGSWSSGNNKIEVGMSNVSGTKQWKTIHFDTTFPIPPVVIASLQSANGGDAVDVHVRNITTQSMEIALFEEERKMGSGHITETVGYLLVASEANGFELGNNTGLIRISLPFQAAGINVNHNWTVIDNSTQIRLEEDQTSDQEIVHVNELIHVIKINDFYLAQIVSANGSDPSVLRSSRNVDR